MTKRVVTAHRLGRSTRPSPRDSRYKWRSFNMTVTLPGSGHPSKPPPRSIGTRSWHSWEGLLEGSLCSHERTKLTVSSFPQRTNQRPSGSPLSGQMRGHNQNHHVWRKANTAHKMRPFLDPCHIFSLVSCIFNLYRFYRRKPLYLAVTLTWSTWVQELQDINLSSKSPWHSRQYHLTWWRWESYFSFALVSHCDMVPHKSIEYQPWTAIWWPLCCFSRFTWWWQLWVAFSRNGSQPNQIYPTPSSGTRQMHMVNVSTDCPRRSVSLMPIVKIKGASAWPFSCQARQLVVTCFIRIPR